MFERENNTSYMVIGCEKETGSDYDVNILGKNVAHSLLHMHMRNTNDKSFCYYDITAKQQVVKLYAYTQLIWDDVRMICESIAAMVKDVNKYMLDLRCVRLSPEYMYVDVCEHKVFFTYVPSGEVPDEKCSFDKELRGLFDYILEHLNHNEPKDEVMKVYEIYQRIVQNNYDAEKLDELVSVHREEMVVSEVIDVVPPEVIEEEVEEKDGAIQGIVLLMKVVAVVIMLLGVVKILLPSVVPFDMSMKIALVMVIAGTVIMLIAGRIPDDVFVRVRYKKQSQPCEIQYCEIEDKAQASTEYKTKSAEEYKEWFKEQRERLEEPQTMLLAEYIKKSKKVSDERVKLVNYDYDEIINIEIFPAIIGNLKEKCNVCIEDVLVSRMHACVIKDDGEFYIEDLNSTNGTKVNDKTLVPDEKQVLKSGDEILFATRFYKVEIS